MTVEYHHLFSNAILTRGYSLANDKNIQNVQFSQDELSANVLGSKLYDVHVELKNGKISTLSCTCPVSTPCKHLAALFLLLDEIALEKRLNKTKS